MKSLSRVWVVASSLVALLFLVACGGNDLAESPGEEAQALTAPTQVSTFVFLASGRLTLLDRAQVTGGNIGVAGGAVGGANSITTGLDSSIGVGKGMMGRRIVLNQRAAVGDLFVTQLVPQGGTFSSQSAFSAPPALPPISTFTAGTTALTVNSGQTVTLAAADRGAVTVNGTLRLSGGTYQFQSLTLGPGAIVQPTAASIVRVAGRVTAADRARIVPATGLNASALRLVVAGANDTTGGVSFGTDGQLTGLVISRASFSAGARFIGTGAIAASNLSFGSDLRFTFNTGFGCNTNATCNDGNECSTDSCLDAQCVHPAAANGTACSSDGNVCTNDVCTSGACTHGNANGTACTLPNASATCSGGACGIVSCNAGFGDCDIDPATGCETNVLVDESNCGQCGAACFTNNGVQGCSSGTCSGPVILCFDGFDDCDLDPTNGCEADILFDESNCGQCGAACFVDNGVAACASGLCTDDIKLCFADWGNCDGDPSNGCETDVANDANNCGDCGISCNVNGSGICTSGTCQVVSCQPSFDSCDNDSSNGCETDLTTAASCGECGNVCRFGGQEPFCAGEQCTCTPGSGNLPGSCATCQDQHDAVVQSSRTVTLTGFSSGPLDLIEVSALKDQGQNPADCAVQQNNALWQDLTPTGLSQSTVAFTRASPTQDIPRLNFYQWSITLTVPAQFWPEGGLTRLRIIGGGAAFEDEPAVVLQDPTESCVARDPEIPRSFANLVQRCAGASIYQTCPNQVGTRQIVTLVSPNPTPAEANKVATKSCTPTNGTPVSLGRFINQMEPDLRQAASPCNFDAEAQNYYSTIDPQNQRTTFQDWLNANPLLANSTEVSAKYYNTGDLGVGRDMHCWYTAEGSSCYVSNYGAAFLSQPKTEEQALNEVIHHADLGLNPLATVAMEWREICPIVNGHPDCTAPHSRDKEVQFFVFDGSGQRIKSVPLDTEGAKPVPGNCLSCHGGTYDLANHIVKNANFLPFDTCSFSFSAEHPYTLAEQQDDFKELNLLVWITQPETRNGGGIQEFLNGVYREGGGIFVRDTLDESWVPDSWQLSPGLEQVYLDVVKPYCRSCHLSRLAVGHTLDPFLLKAAAQGFACAPDNHHMPHAERTQHRFWTSSARAELMNALNNGTLGTPASNGCAP